MPQYYFHLLDGIAPPDTRGINLVDGAAAQLHACKLATALLNGPKKARPQSGAQMLVTNANSEAVCSVDIFGPSISRDAN